MRILEKGHKYQLDNVAGPEGQVITFVRKEAEANGILVTAENGTTNEEVLAMLIDRFEHLNSLLPCRENENIISYLQRALEKLNQRKADREKRKVIGTSKK